VGKEEKRGGGDRGSPPNEREARTAAGRRGGGGGGGAGGNFGPHARRKVGLYHVSQYISGGSHTFGPVDTICETKPLLTSRRSRKASLWLRYYSDI